MLYMNRPVFHTSMHVFATRCLAAVPRTTKTIQINRLAAAGSSTKAASHDALQQVHLSPQPLVEEEALQQPQQSGSVGADASNKDAEGNMDQRERLRRQRISSANKGRVPWNKGRKHSPGRWLVKHPACV